MVLIERISSDCYFGFGNYRNAPVGELTIAEKISDKEYSICYAEEGGIWNGQSDCRQSRVSELKIVAKGPAWDEEMNDG